jgi:hypothetical protein
LVCDDGDVCNGIESCDAATGCLAGGPDLPDTSACDDSLACTVDDECTSGACGGRALTSADCDDSDVATSDFCLEGFGCLSCRAVKRSRFKIKFAKLGGSDGRIKISSDVTPVGGGSLSPPAEILTVVVEVDGVEFYRAVLAAGLLVETKPGRFLFKDKTGAIAGGLRSVKLKRRSGEQYKLRLSTTKSAFAQIAATNVKVSLPLGDDCFSAAPVCKTVAGGRLLSCKD